MTKISICIPAFRRPQNIERLLKSIKDQTFKDYDIIITDDSMDDSLKSIIEKYSHLPLYYYKNRTPLGTPANWNFGISKAKGEWIKIMHDDDWFVDNESLKFFAEETEKGERFIFSRYNNVFDTGETSQPSFPPIWRKRIVSNPHTLLARNVIGPPSVTLIHHTIKEKFDTLMKWRVDIDFYIRILEKERSYTVIEKKLINVGISASQVTNLCINVPEVELSEGLLLLNKHGVNPLRNILLYDAWWRILRNVNVRNENQLKEYVSGKIWPKLIVYMVKHQSIISPKLLRMGPVSKLAMLLSYFVNRNLIKD